MFVALLPLAFIAYCESPDLAVLKKGEWICTQSHTETVMTPVTTGKTTTMVPSAHNVCTQYNAI